MRDIQVGYVVPIAKEGPLPPDTALSHVVREPFDHQSLKFGHNLSSSRMPTRLSCAWVFIHPEIRANRLKKGADPSGPEIR